MVYVKSARKEFQLHYTKGIEYFPHNGSFWMRINWLFVARGWFLKFKPKQVLYDEIEWTMNISKHMNNEFINIWKH